jgi:hypothetical protein
MTHRCATRLCFLAGCQLVGVAAWPRGLHAEPSGAASAPDVLATSGTVAAEPGSLVAGEPVAGTPLVAEPVAGQAHVEEAAAPAPRSRRAVGAIVDLFPIVLSATAGEVGLSGQLWLGIDHVRLRLVGARIAVPNGIAANDGFEDQLLLVAAGIVDYTFGSHFDGWWLGAGVEYWDGTMSIVESPGSTASWQALMTTFGGGYIFRFGKSVHFCLEPWAGLHLRMTPAKLTFDDEAYTPQRVSATVSLKLGVFIDL